ncbi:LysM peptidoglycan-binding domain-containing protein, partial [Andreprevotia sp. IGB-42]|uniref:LysM peptidoglycan-binding domain-containing protein n=1 Tax=Andreprevotia sp. IGB-42 TaxID=2497473 RepID=UPI001357B59C
TLTEVQEYFGRTTSKIDLGGHIFTYTYNRAGWLTKQTGSTGQLIEYNYYANGYIKSMLDRTLKVETVYAYDREGNRTFEGYRNVVPSGSVVEYYQSANISYDALNRISRVLNADERADIRYQYDQNGNVRRILTEYKSADGDQRSTQDLWYAYDAMNRFTVTQGALETGADGTKTITKGSAGVAIAYDLAGRRIYADYAADYGAAGGTAHQESYKYTNEGYLTTVTIDGVERSSRTLDLAGRVVTSVQKDGSGNVVETRISQYLGDNRVAQQTVLTGGSTNVTDYTYLGDGTLAKTESVTNGSGGNGTRITTSYSYEWWDGAKEKNITVVGALLKNNPSGWLPGQSAYSYDVNGHVASVEVADKFDTTVGNRRFSYRTSAEGLVLRRDEYVNGLVHRWRQYYYVGGKRVGDVANDGPSRDDYADTLQALNNSGGNDNRYKNWKPVASADFDQNYEPISPSYPGQAAGSYIAHKGDSLQGVAQAVWGDASMWYLLADANGLTGQEALQEGQVLVIPNKVTNIHHTSQTQRVYNPGEAMGEVAPTLPNAPTPPTKGCGQMGKILMMVVAVIASVVTAGAAMMAMGSLILSGALGAAAGSAASQLVGMATGDVDKFSWSQVGQAAVVGAVTAGISSGVASGPIGEAIKGFGFGETGTAV